MLLSFPYWTTSQRCLQISITSIFYQGCIGIDSKAWPPWHCCKGDGRETAWWGLPCCLCAAEGWEEESISGLDLHSLSFTNKNWCGENWHWFNTWWITAHCSLVRCIHARLLGPSSLQCPVTFICGCAIINLSSPLILSLSSPLILSSYPLLLSSLLTCEMYTCKITRAKFSSMPRNFHLQLCHY